MRLIACDEAAATEALARLELRYANRGTALAEAMRAWTKDRRVADFTWHARAAARARAYERALDTGARPR